MIIQYIKTCITLKKNTNYERPTNDDVQSRKYSAKKQSHEKTKEY